MTDAYPDGWYIRVMFDELLDPSVETLTEILDDEGMGTGTFSGSIADTHPVTLQCQSVNGNALVNVDYDGYYSPAGNAVTWPLGPSLVIKPNDPTLIATGKECQITLNDNITDKDGNPVPADQRGPFKFKTSAIALIATDPTDSGEADDPAEVDVMNSFSDNFYYQFNTDVDVTSFCADTDAAADGGGGLCDEGTEVFQLDPPVSPADGGGLWGYCNSTGDFCSTAADCTDAADTRCDSSYVYTYSGLQFDDEIGIGYNTPLKTEQEYKFSLKPNAKLKDRCGNETTIAESTPDNLFAIRFLTNKFGIKTANIATGETSAMAKKLTLPFTAPIDVTTLAATEYTIEPQPAAFVVGQLTGGDAVFGGNYAPGTDYKFTLKKDATITDWYGKEYKAPEDLVITWKTAPSVLLTTATADNTVIQKIASPQLVGVTLTFNANMDLATFTADDFTFVDGTGAAVSGLTIGVGGSGNTCAAVSLGCQLRVRGDLAAGDYTFTLKKDAQFTDKLGNMYTQAADRVIHLTVKAPVPPVQCL